MSFGLEHTEPTIETHYSRAMDVVNLLNAGQGDAPDDYWLDLVERNVVALNRFLTEYDWPEELDLTPIHAAIAAYEN
jgi:hypothetical protein